MVYNIVMANLTKVCEKCGKQFLVIESEQKFLTDKGCSLPTQCPPCRQIRRYKLRGGERMLYKTKCQKCGKDIIVAYNPEGVKNPIYCIEDYQKHITENDPIIKDPLPEV